MASRPLLKVGIPVSLSGRFQVQGKQALIGLQAWADDVNRSGGIVLGCRGTAAGVSVIHHDDSGRPEQAKQITERLITQDRVDLLFGPYSSVLSRAAAQVSESHQRLLWNQGGASDDIYQQGYRWVVGVLTPASRYLAGLLPLVREANAAAKTVGLLRVYPGTFPLMIAAEVQRQADLLSFEVVYDRQYSPSVTDFSDILGEIKEAGPQVLLAVGRISNDLNFARQLAQQPLDLRAIAVVAAPIRQFQEALGHDVDGFIGPSQWEPAGVYDHDYGPSAQEVLASLSKWHHGPVDYPMAQAYAAGLVAQRCVEQAGTCDDPVLRETAGRLDFTTFYGRFRIDPATGCQVGRSSLIVQWQGGRKLVLWPLEQRQAPLLHPWPGWERAKARTEKGRPSAF